MAGGNTETLTRTIVFTDLVGSTALRIGLGDRAADDVRQEHDRVLGEAIAQHRGVLAKGLGDGVMAVFESAADAVDCVVAMQQAIEWLRRKRGVALSIRVGLSAGDVALEEADWFGTPVIEAARLEAAAKGDQILASELVRLLAGSRTEAVFEPVEPLTLKGLPAPLQVCSIAWEPRPSFGPLPLQPLFAAARQFAFVGRTDERETIAATWDTAVGGHQQMVLIAGEAGIGKTRLASELAERAHKAGAIVLSGGCDEDLGLPYQPFVEALRHFVDQAPEDLVQRAAGPYAAELVRLVPELVDRVPPSASASSDPDTERYRLFEAVVSWLSALADEEPVLIVLDDLHWAAKPTLLLLRHIHSSPQAKRVLVVGTYRPTDIDQNHPLSELLAVLHRGPETCRIGLDGLDGISVAALLAEAFDRPLSDADVALATAIREATAGNAFFAGEVVRHVVETGVDRFDPTMVPDSVREVVGSRVARMPEPTRELLVAAAVIGPRFNVHLVAAVTGQSEESALDALDDASRIHVVEETGPEQYQFSHALVRETILAEQSESRRVRMHRKIADVIQARYAEDLEGHLVALAYHLAEVAHADPTVAFQAMGFSIRAGDQALARLAPDEAADWYRRALELLDQTEVLTNAGLLSAERECDLLIALGDAQIRAADPAARQTLLDAAARAGALDDAERLGRAALANNRGYWSTLWGVDEERVTVLRSALERLGPAPTLMRSRLLAMLAVEQIFTTRRSEREQLCDEALAIARAAGDDATLAAVMCNRGTACYSPAHSVERLAAGEELLQLASRLGDLQVRYHALDVVFTDSLVLADIDLAERTLAEQLELVQRLGQPYLRWGMDAWHRPCHALLAGRLAEAEQIATAAYSLAEGIVSPEEAFTYYGQVLAMLGFERGTLGELIGLIEDPAEMPQPMEVRAFLALAHLEAGNDEAAREVAAMITVGDWDHTMDLGQNHLPSGALLTEVFSRLGDLVWCQQLRASLDPYRGRIATIGLVAWGAVDRYTGLLHAALGDHDAAVRDLENAIEINQRVRAPTWAARSQVDLATVLLARGRESDAPRALDLARSAAESAHAVGATGIERRARALSVD